jgi:hypothetical protein
MEKREKTIKRRVTKMPMVVLVMVVVAKKKKRAH